MNILLLPLQAPALAVRALDDLHVLAREVPRALDLLEQLAERGGQIVDMGERLELHAERVLVLGEQVLSMGNRFDALGHTMADEARATQEAAISVVGAAHEILTAMPLLEKAIALGEPLEGAVERIGRIVDRLPGGRPRTGPGPH